jgi:hypothetical protein
MKNPDEILTDIVSIICDAMRHAAERKEKREKDDPSRDSNHTPSAIWARMID